LIKKRINEMAMKLYVGGLAYAITDKDLEALFTEFGAVVSSTVIKDRDSGQSKGFGFVEMSDDTAAKAAMSALNGKEVSGRSIMVNEARPQEDRRSGGSFSKSY
jgi:RNA recognition motif-containing protein